MNIIKNFLLLSKNIDKSSYLWNTASAFLNSFQTVILLVFISRIDSVTDAGILTIAYAIANLMFTIGKYGERQFQSSDIKEKYSFSDYFYSRIFTLVLMLVITIGYILFNFYHDGYTIYKATAIFMICLIKAVDAFEDVIHGFFQQKGRLDIAGKILTIRLFGFTSSFVLIYILTNSLVITGLLSFIFSLILFLLMNFFALKNFSIQPLKFHKKNILLLIKECFPLFLSTYLIMYIGNAPKYAIDSALSDEIQAAFGYVFMPVFVISLLSSFIYQPILHKLAIIWDNKDVKKFKTIILRQTLFVIAITIICMIGGFILGIPVLSIVFGTNLQAYQNELVILLLGGGLLALVNFYHMIITIVRFQNYLIFGYIVIYILLIVLSKPIVMNFGLLSLSTFYTISLLLLTLIFLSLIIIIIKKAKTN